MMSAFGVRALHLLREDARVREVALDLALGAARPSLDTIRSSLQIARHTDQGSPTLRHARRFRVQKGAARMVSTTLRPRDAERYTSSLISSVAAIVLASRGCEAEPADQRATGEAGRA